MKKAIRERLERASYRMDLTIVVPKKDAKLAVQRFHIKHRLHTALRQVVQHGIACDVTADTHVQSVKPGPAHWLVPGGNYCMWPESTVYAAPQYILLDRVSWALRAVMVSRSSERIIKRVKEQSSS